jgi:hypothetical protein
MTDFENRLRAEVTRRTEDFAPSPDLPERIGKRVRRRRRQRRLTAAGLSAGLAVAVVAGFVVTRPADDGADVVAEGRRSTTTAASPSPTSPPTIDEDTPTTTTTETTEATGPTDGGGPTTSTPSPSATTGTTEATPTTTVPVDLKPADDMQPAASTCGQPSGSIAEVTINPDIPSPRCTEVTADQRLQVRNNTDQQITVSLADFSATLSPGAAQLYDRPFGDYLEPGVHRITVSLYGDSGPEIWLLP